MRVARGRIGVAGIAVVVAGLAAGVAYAAIPDSNGVIHGCYDKNNGGLRVIDPSAGGACKTSETALDWSHTGPQGVQGPQGPQGAQGPSNAYDSGIQSHSYGSGGDTIASLALPAGSYMLWAPTVVTPDPTDFNSVCGLYKNDVTAADYIPSIDYTVQYDSHDTTFGRATPMATLTLSSQTTILINCSGDKTASASSEIFALKVGSVN